MSKNEENPRLRAWNNKVQNDLSGALASMGAMLEQQNEFLQQAFEAVLQHNNQVDSRLDSLEKHEQENNSSALYEALTRQLDALSNELGDMKTALGNMGRELNHINGRLKELLDKPGTGKEEPKPVLPRKDLHPWVVKHIFKADQVYREAGAWYLLRKHNGNAQSLGCYTLRELYARNKIQLRKNKLEDELSSLS